MKKYVFACFGLLISMSSSFATESYRHYFAMQFNDEIIEWCEGSGGTCLDTVVITP